MEKVDFEGRKHWFFERKIIIYALFLLGYWGFLV